MNKSITLNDIPEQVRKVREDLLGLGVNLVIAGGSIRDIYHGRDCKDFDLVLLAPEYKVYEVLYRNTIKNYLGGFANFREFKNYTENCNSRFGSCMKTEIDGIQIDIVEMRDLQGKLPKTLQEVFNLFDFNLNQFGIDEKGEFYTNFDSDSGEIVSVREDYLLARMEYLKGKYPQYKWPKAGLLC